MVGLLRRSESRRRHQRNEFRPHGRPRNLSFGRDPAMVAASGGGGANADGILAGGQVGCNLQSGTLVYGLEGDFDYFRSNPKFSNNTNTLADGIRRLPSRSRSQPISWRQCVRGSASRRIAISLTSPAARPSPASATPKATWTRTLRPAPAPRPLRDHSWVGPPVQAGNMPLPTIGRSEPNIYTRASRRRVQLGAITGGRRSQSAPRFLGSRDPAHPRRRELQILIARDASCSTSALASTFIARLRTRRHPAAARRAKQNGNTMSTNHRATNASAASAAVERSTAALGP